MKETSNISLRELMDAVCTSRWYIFEESIMKINKVFACICVVSGALLTFLLYKLNGYDDKVNQLKETVISSVDGSIDTIELHSTVPDAIGWIQIPGTSIDYPLLQGRDNSFYLTHDFYGKNNLIGAVFIDYLNDSQLQDPITLVYGHNVMHGGIFSELHSYEDPTYLLKHRHVMIHVERDRYVYEIVALYKIATTDFNDFIQDHYDESQKQIALVTCSYENELSIHTNMRYVLLAKKV